MSTTSVSELGYLFFTSPVCNRMALDLDVKDHCSGWIFLDDVIRDTGGGGGGRVFFNKKTLNTVPDWAARWEEQRIWLPEQWGGALALHHNTT
jgi:hypothetical protein